MNIGMIAYTNYERDARVRREAEALAARGDKVDFLCLRDGEGPGAKIVSGVRLIRLNVRQYRGESTVRYILSYLRFFVRATIMITIQHIRKGYAIVHVHTMPDFLVFCAAIPKIFGAKVILDVHDLTPELYASKFGVGRKPRVIRFLTFVERCSIAFADRAIAVHKPHLEALQSHGNPSGKFSVLLNTPDQRLFERISPGASRKDGFFRLVYHGTISSRQGLEVALRAIAVVRRRIPRLFFDVLGEGDDLQRLVQLTHELRLDDIVRFSGGYIAVDKLCARIRDADVGLIPILQDSFTQYVLPAKLLDNVFLGIPTIASRTKCIECYFDESMVRYVDAGSVDSLADAIYDLFSHPEKRRALVENADRFNKRFSWEKESVAFLNFVDTVASLRSWGGARAGRRTIQPETITASRDEFLR